MSKNIRDLVLEAMTTDDSFNEGNSRNIIKLYNSASISEKELVDNIFINLCGYSIDSLVGLNINEANHLQRDFSFKNEITL